MLRCFCGDGENLKNIKRKINILIYDFREQTYILRIELCFIKPHAVKTKKN